MPTPLVSELVPLILEVQAGGGGSFSGGGGSSYGGGSSGGGGDAWLIYYLIRLVFEAPLIGIPLLILALWILKQTGGKASNRYKGRTISRAGAELSRRRPRVSWAELLARDPDFDAGRLIQRVTLAFHRAQAGWCSQDLTDVEPFLSDGVYERFSIQIDGQREEGWRQSMTGTRLGRITIVQVESDANYDAVTLRIPFHSNIAQESLKTGKPVPNTRLDKRKFVECWTFLRRLSAKTRATKGLMEGMCPNCGADLLMNHASTCKTCGCHAKSGEFDWVLTEITQESVWEGTLAGEVPGISNILRTDPGMSVPLLEDMASVAFWRKCAADRSRSVIPLMRVGTQQLCADYDAVLTERAGSAWQYKTDCAVGSMSTLGLLADEDEQVALVEVHWDGVRVAITEDGRHHKRERRHLQRTILIFKRRADQQSDLGTAFTTCSCPNCGTHDQGGIDPLCPYCDEPRTRGKSAWLLDGIEYRMSPRVQGLLGKLTRIPKPAHATRSPSTLLTWAISMARADGELSSKERHALSGIAERSGVDDASLEAMIEEAEEGLNSARPSDPSQSREWLGQLIRIALADGHLAGAEQQMLKHAATRLRITSAEFKAMLKAERDSLYKQAKQALKESRGQGNP